MHIKKLPPLDPDYWYSIMVDRRPEGGDVYQRDYPHHFPVHEAITDLVWIALGSLS